MPRVRDEEWVSASEAARRLGMTAQALGHWATREGAPVWLTNNRYSYQWPNFPKWRERLLVETARDRGKDVDIAEGQRRKIVAEATKAEIELAQIQAEVITRELVRKAVGADYDVVRAQILAMAPRIAVVCMGVKSVQEAVGRIEPLLHEALAILSSGEIEQITQEAA